MGILKKAARLKPVSVFKTVCLRMATTALCCYGVYAFIMRRLGEYMLLNNAYVFFDFSEPLICFLLDYLAIMAFFACAGNYFFKLLKQN